MDSWYNQPADPKLDALVRGIPRPSLFAANAFFWLEAALFAVFTAVLPKLYALLNTATGIGTAAFIAASEVILYLIAVALPVILYLLRRREVCGSFRLNPVLPGDAILAVFTALTAFLAANMLATLWMILLESVGATLTSSSVKITGDITADLLLMAVLPGVCEELLFRGMILAGYERRGTWKAIWISALLFTGMHGSLEGLPAELMMGVVLGYVAVTSDSIYTGMMVHTMYNAAAVIAGYSATAAEETAAMTVLESIGGASGVLTCIVCLLIVGVVLLSILRRFGVRRLKAERLFGNVEMIDETPMGRSELLILISGIATILWFYIDDALTLFF